MTDDRAFDRAVEAWLDDRSDRAPDGAIDAVLFAVRSTRQDRAPRFRRIDRSAVHVRQLAVGIAIGLVVVVTAVGVTLGIRGPSTATEPSLAPAASAAAPTPTPAPSVVSDIPATGYAAVQPTFLSTDGTAMWVTAGSWLERIDPATGATESFDIGAPGHVLGSIAATPDGIWVPDFTTNQVLRIDPQTHRTVATVPADAAVTALVVDHTIWVADHHTGQVTRVDPSTNDILDTLDVGGFGDNGPSSLTLAHGSVWVTESNVHQFVRVDVATGKVTDRVAFPQGDATCGGVADGAAALWASCGSSVVRIDPVSNRVAASIGLDPGYASDPVVVDGQVWVAIGGPAGELERIDPATNRVDRRVGVGSLTDVIDAAVAFDSLWLTDPDGLVLRFPLSELQGS